LEGDEDIDEECEEGDLITNDDQDEMEDLEGEGDEGEGDEGETEEQMDYYMR
jgi:hypothetical protein